MNWKVVMLPEAKMEYALTREGEQMTIIIISARADEAVYKEAATKTHFL